MASELSLSKRGQASEGGRACTFLVCVQIHMLVCVHKLKFGAFFFYFLFSIKISIDLLNLAFLSYEIQGDLKSKFL